MTALDYVFRTRQFLAKHDWSTALATTREGLLHYPEEAKLLRLRLYCRLTLEGVEKVFQDTEEKIDSETGERLTKWIVARKKAGDVSPKEDEAWAESLLSIFDDTATWQK